uniref:Uncharacterized protein n=1 Tax=Arundo donax TaxID=35708 RepID=A0A0A9AWY9_ARUDO
MIYTRFFFTSPILHCNCKLSRISQVCSGTIIWNKSCSSMVVMLNIISYSCAALLL